MALSDSAFAFVRPVEKDSLAFASNDAKPTKPPLTPESSQFNPDSPTGRFPTRSPRPGK